jgi:hypothetical protein
LNDKKRSDVTFQPSSENATPGPTPQLKTEFVGLGDDDLITTRQQISSELYEIIVSEDASIGPPDTDNQINNAQLRNFRARYEAEFLALLRTCEFEYGFDSLADAFVETRLRESTFVTMHWIGQLFFEHLDDPAVAIGILRVLAHLKYEQACPLGISIAITATRHKNHEVQECGIRAFENWDTPDSLKVLEVLTFSEPWIQKYVDQVVEDLRSQIVSNHAG